MSVVSGTLTDFELEILSMFAKIVFTPSGPATALGGGGLPLLMASKPIVCIPVAGAFSQELYPNEGTTPETWYTITIIWLNGAGVPIGKDQLPGRLYVTNEGGPITNGQLRMHLSPLGVWTTTTDALPPDGFIGDFQWNTTTDDIFRLI